MRPVPRICLLGGFERAVLFLALRHDLERARLAMATATSVLRAFVLRAKRRPPLATFG
jgi:hypothetical protein